MPARMMAYLALCVGTCALVVQRPFAAVEQSGRRRSLVCMDHDAAKAAWLARQATEPSWKVVHDPAAATASVLPGLQTQLESKDQALAESTRKLEALQHELAVAEAAAHQAKARAAEARFLMLEDAAKAAWLEKQDSEPSWKRAERSVVEATRPDATVEAIIAGVGERDVVHAAPASDALADFGRELSTAVQHTKEALRELSSAVSPAKAAIQAALANTRELSASLANTTRLAAATTRLANTTRLAAADSLLSGAAKEMARASEALLTNISAAVPPAMEALRASSDALGRELSAADSPLRDAAKDTARLSGNLLKNVGEVLVLNQYSKEKLTNTTKAAHDLAGARTKCRSRPRKHAAIQASHALSISARGSMLPRT